MKFKKSKSGNTIVPIIKGHLTIPITNKKYEIDFNIRLGEMYGVASEIINKHIKNSEYIDLSYLTSTDLTSVTLKI